jgi:hypothetical protein
MTRRDRFIARVLIPGVAAGVVAAAGARAEGATSAALARELAALLAERQLDAYAVQDPETPNRFLATLFIPGAQMLVVSAEYPNPAELQAHLAQKNYRDVYTALHQPAAESTRFFLIDAGCNGVSAGGDGVDVLYEKGKSQTVFDGDWKKQGVSEATYRERFENAEKQYARVLNLFMQTLKAPPTDATGAK